MKSLQTISACGRCALKWFQRFSLTIKSHAALKRAKKASTCANVIEYVWTTSLQVTRLGYLNVTRRPNGNHQSGTRPRLLARRKPGLANQDQDHAHHFFLHPRTGSSQVCRTWNHCELQMLCRNPQKTETQGSTHPARHRRQLEVALR